MNQGPGTLQNCRRPFRETRALVEKTGSLDGDVTTISLVVEDGGRFNGRSNMLRQEKGVPTWKEKKSDTAESKDV